MEIKSQADFENAEPYSRFSCNGEQTDYKVSVEFSSGFPETVDNPDFTSQDKVCVYRNDVLHCYYKARDTEDSFYALRITDGKNIKIVIDKKCAEWIGTEYEKYLRPETLFGTKFEGYLNARINPKQRTTNAGIQNRVSDIDNW